MASEVAMATYCFATNLASEVYFLDVFSRVAKVYFHLLCTDTSIWKQMYKKKLGFALNWRLWKDSFWGKIKEGKKDWYVHSVYKSIKNVSFSLLIENEPFLVNFIHCACFFTLRKRRKNWMNVSLPYSHPKSLLFLMIRLWWKEALMRRFCLLSFSGAPLSYEKSSDVLTKSHWQLHAGMMSSVINALDLNHILLNQRPIKNMGVKLFLTNAFQSLYSS